MSTHSLCFEQEYENYQNFLSDNFPFLVVKFSIYLYRRSFIMCISCFRYMGNIQNNILLISPTKL